MKKYVVVFFIIGFSSCTNEKLDDIKRAKVVFEKVDLHTNAELTDISFINENQGVICGSLGYFSKTDDGGATWKEMNVGVNHTFLSSFLLNENVCFVARRSLFRSVNSGLNFNEIGSPNQSSIFSICYRDTNLGFITQGNRILKTTDGGSDWIEVYNTNAYYGLSDLQFINNVGYACGGADYDNFNAGEIVKSSDHGTSWSILVSSVNINAMSFVNENTGFYTNVNREVYKTTDGGNTWVKISTIDNSPSSIAFKNERSGFISTYQGEILMTEDGGLNWDIVYNQTNISITKIVTSRESVYAIGNSGLFLRSE
jgi:photosystem II stability/assembly factor-like uncharacterized protein